jgi:hypothetical protein
MIVDLFLVYQFLKRLTTPFEKWQACKLGIIDKDGNVLIHRKDFRTEAQRAAFGIFDQMVLNMKKLIEKVPGGKTRIATYAAALYLIREGHDTPDVSERLFEEYIVEVEGSGVPSTNTANIPDTVKKTNSPALKRKKDQLDTL